MNNYKLAILIPTFLRDNLLYKTIQSIVSYYTSNSHILIADQGYCATEKETTIDYFKSQIPLEYYKLPFDSGLGVSKNFLVQKAFELNIPYCLIMSDAIQFVESYNFEPLFKDLDNTILNFKLQNVDPIALKDIFIAKTNLIGDLWDLEMKIYEYKLAFNECINRNYKIIWNDSYNFKKSKYRASDEYYSYAKRIKDFKKLSEQKEKQLCI